ncbi:MAG: hypothetical protein L3J74_16580, partial [Bacteroidales bacterium]|nr:hypothetical protein [Bacteroidales bacterium]
PNSGNFTLSLVLEKSKDYSVKIIDESVKTYFYNYYSGKIGENKLAIRLDKFVSGLKFLIINLENKQITIPFIIH